MIKAEIKKNGQVYTFLMEDSTNLKDAYEKAVKIAQGKEWHFSDEHIIDLGASEVYEHIHVYVEYPRQVPVAAPPAGEEPVEQDGPFEATVKFLDQTLDVKGVKRILDHVPFVLLYDVNGQPAQTLMGKQTLHQLSCHTGNVTGMKEPFPVIPAADIYSKEEAVEYLDDFIRDVERQKEEAIQSAEVNATALILKDEEGGAK